MYETATFNADMKDLYTRPLYSLVNGWTVSIVVSSGFSLVAALSHLFVNDGEKVLLLVILVMLDFVSGIIKALRKKEKVTSLGMRRTLVKSFEYITILTAVTGFANSWDVVSWTKDVAMFYTAWVEVKSIGENITDKNVKEMFNKITERYDQLKGK